MTTKFKNTLQRYQVILNGNLVDIKFSNFEEIAAYAGCARSWIHIQFKRNNSTEFKYKKNTYQIIGL